MHILIIGAAGMIGRKLTAALLRDGLGGTMPAQLTLADVVAPTAPETNLPCRLVAADLSDPATAADLVAARPDVIFHLAAIVSGEAEADFDKGYRINLDGTRHLLEAIRAGGGNVLPTAAGLYFVHRRLRRAPARRHSR